VNCETQVQVIANHIKSHVGDVSMHVDECYTNGCSCGGCIVPRKSPPVNFQIIGHCKLVARHHTYTSPRVGIGWGLGLVNRPTRGEAGKGV
jgi:hypothetical protein